MEHVALARLRVLLTHHISTLVYVLGSLLCLGLPSQLGAKATAEWNDNT